MNGFIYKITNKVNGKIYIGQTRFTVEHRFKQHIKNFNIEHRKQPLYAAFAKYGLENFTVETIESVDCSKLNEREIYWIAYYNSFKEGYNATLGGNGNKYIFTDSQYEEIKSLYLSGFTIKKIGQLFNVSNYTIRGILNNLNVKIRRHPMDMNNYEAQELINDYKQGKKLITIAKEYGTDRETVKRFLISKGITLKQKSIILTDENLQESMIKDFLDGKNFKQLESIYHSDMRTLKRILVERGINIKSTVALRSTKGFYLTAEQCLELIQDYNNKMKFIDISKKYNINITTIYELLKRYNVKSNRYNRSKSAQVLSKEGLKCTPTKHL